MWSPAHAILAVIREANDCSSQATREYREEAQRLDRAAVRADHAGRADPFRGSIRRTGAVAALARDRSRARCTLAADYHRRRAVQPAAGGDPRADAAPPWRAGARRPGLSLAL